MKNIVVFASGSGTNAEKIIEYFQDSPVGTVTHVFSNVKTAGVLDRAKALGVRTFVFNTEELNGAAVLDKLKSAKTDLIVLAGFLKKIPASIVEAYEDNIINIHPSLLPDYGGKGMYGMNVHRAVVENEEEETGITIHYVNENYDEGDIIFQESVEVDYEDTPEDVAYKVQQLEHQHFAPMIEWVINESED